RAIFFGVSSRLCFAVVLKKALLVARVLPWDGSLIKADASRQKGIDGARGLPPEAASRAVEEYLAVLDDAAFGAATEVPPKFISPADPAARWTGAHGGQAFFRLLDKLSRRSRQRDRRRCRGHHRHPPGRGHRG